MAVTFIEVKVSNPESPERARTFTFLVDSGAVYSVMPRDDLAQLGLSPISSEAFILANGEKLEMPVGNAYFEHEGKTRAAPVVFGDPEIFVLGATTLEALGLILDPIHRELKPLPMLLMEHQAGDSCIPGKIAQKLEAV